MHYYNKLFPIHNIKLLQICKFLKNMKWNYIITITISRAGRIPNFARVLKNASLFWGCNVWENAQNSLKKLTCNVRKYSEKPTHMKRNLGANCNMNYQCGIKPSQGPENPVTIFYSMVSMFFRLWGARISWLQISQLIFGIVIY